MASLLTLPPELIPHILSHLPLPSLSRFSRTSSYFHALSLPLLFRHLRLSFAIPNDPEDPTEEEREESERQKELIKQTLRMLAEKEERCGMIRLMEVWNYGHWLGEEEAGSLEKVVKQSKGMWEVRLLQDDDGAPFDPLLTPLAHFGPIWSALQSLPSLTKLRTSYGPNVLLRFDSFPALTEVDMAMYYVDLKGDGAMSEGLKRLRLEYVQGFEAQVHEGPESAMAWIKPAVFERLESLTLVDMSTEAALAVARAVEAYTALPSSPPSSLTNLSLTLFDLAFPISYTHAVPTILTLLRSFAALKSVQYLSLGSSPHPLAFAVDEVGKKDSGDPVGLMKVISEGYRETLRGLAFFVGESPANFVFVNNEAVFSDFRALLSKLKHLTTFQTNLLLLFPSNPSLTIARADLRHTPPDCPYALRLFTTDTDWKPAFERLKVETERMYREVLPGGKDGRGWVEVGGVKRGEKAKGREGCWELPEEEIRGETV